MRKGRQIRNRSGRRKAKPLEIDITSLLDILVIMLVFLLQSYNSSGVVLNVPKEVSLPTSESQNLNSPGVLVQVSKDKIWVEDKIVLSMEEMDQTGASMAKNFDHGGKRIVPLFNELTKIKENIKIVEKRATTAKPFSGTINLVVDKSLKYSYLKKLLYTSAEAGYVKFKFVVLGEEL